MSSHIEMQKIPVSEQLRRWASFPLFDSKLSDRILKMASEVRALEERVRELEKGSR